MTFGHRATRTHRLAIASLGAVLAVSGTVLASPATAQPSPDAAAARECETTAASSARTVGGPGPVHDTEVQDISPAERARVQKEIDATAASYRLDAGGARSAATSTPAIRVPVWIHVIRGTHAGDRTIGWPAVSKMFGQLKNGFNGGQNPSMAGSGITFVLRAVDFHTNDSWFHGGPGSAADNAMKRKLHRGYGWGLNIYVKAPKYAGNTLLGFSRFPWHYRLNRQLDGVTVHVDSLSGGRFRHYNYGDTLIHETGHWFGLLHTFEGGCTGIGDGVSDTPAELIPAAGCPLGRDTCTSSPGYDPVTNFMDYGFDTCMNNFTAGQQARMKAAFLRYRYNVK